MMSPDAGDGQIHPAWGGGVPKHQVCTRDLTQEMDRTILYMYHDVWDVVLDVIHTSDKVTSDKITMDTLSYSLLTKSTSSENVILL